MHDRRCFPVKTNKNIKKNLLAPREILWKCFGTQCVKDVKKVFEVRNFYFEF